MAGGKTFTVRRGQTAIPNATIYGSFSSLATEDGEPRRLSITALGLLLLMLSRPQGKASMGYRAFLDRGMGKTAVMRGLRELDAAGLRHQFKRRAPGGRGVITDTVVSECVIDRAEAEEIWLAEGHIPLSKTGTSQPEPVAQEDLEPEPDTAAEPVDNSPIPNGPEIGANGSQKGLTVLPFKGALSTGAQLSRESSKVSFAPTSQETELNQKAATGNEQTPGENSESPNGAEDQNGDMATPPPGMTGREWALSLAAKSRQKREREARQQEATRKRFAAQQTEYKRLAASGGALDGGNTPGAAAAWPTLDGGN